VEQGTKHIWSAWLQGRHRAPETVQRIFRLWEMFNPDWVVHIVEEEEAQALLASIGVQQDNLSPQIKADLVRLTLLAKRSGVWIDATLLPTTPLSSWLTKDLRSQGFFAFQSTGDPNLVLQNWFLYAAEGNPLIVEWLQAFAGYFSTQRIYPTWKRALYHLAVPEYLAFQDHIKRRDTAWFVDPAGGLNCRFYPYAVTNYVLARILQQRRDLQDMWLSVPKRTQMLPSLIGMMAGDPETTQQTFLSAAREALAVAPVHKLNYRDPRFLPLIGEVERTLATSTYPGPTASAHARPIVPA
jgi:hypothetical protein